MTDPSVTMLKQIETFQPSALIPVAQSERHYLEVHRRWAVEALAHSPSLVTYHTTIFDAQWDICGRFEQSPSLWRMASLQFRPPGEEFPPALLAMLNHDHPKFLRDLRSFDVAEEVAVDRTTGQLSSTKYLVTVDRPEGVDRDDAVRAGDDVLALLTDGLQDAYGARRLIVNRVHGEQETAPVDEPGQQVTGVALESDRLLMLEIYFDDAVWGDQFFARAEIGTALRGSIFAPASLVVLRGTEQTGHDRR